MTFWDRLFGNVETFHSDTKVYNSTEDDFNAEMIDTGATSAETENSTTANIAKAVVRINTARKFSKDTTKKVAGGSIKFDGKRWVKDSAKQAFISEDGYIIDEKGQILKAGAFTGFEYDSGAEAIIINSGV